MKRILTIILAALMLTGCTSGDKSSEKTAQPRSGSVMPLLLKEQSETEDEPLQLGMWMSYIDLAPMLAEESPEAFRERFEQACRNISSLGLNTVYVHVRPFGDAVYRSELYPPSAYLSGDYDPLEIMCDTAHAQGLRLHAWINPLRLQTPEQLDSLTGDFETLKWYKLGDPRVRSVEGDAHLWLDPAYPEVRQLIAQGAAEIAANYPVDGIHYDDYFYPTTDESFDAQCFQETAQAMTLKDWRTENISMMCREIYEAVKSSNSSIQVEISPQGNIENDYEYMYADVKRWCREPGFCDRMIPQVYYGYEDPVKPFLETLSQWQSLERCPEVELDMGLAAYKIGSEGEFTDNEGILSEQALDALEAGCGVSLYTYGSFFGDTGFVSQRMEQEGTLFLEAVGRAENLSQRG